MRACRLISWRLSACYRTQLPPAPPGAPAARASAAFLFSDRMQKILPDSTSQNEAIVMRQFDLSLKPDMQIVDMSIVRAQPSMTAALMLTQQVSGVEDKELCGRNGIVKDAAQWSRIKSGQHFFPQNKMNEYFDICKNEAALFWLADKRGYELKQKETETERQLRVERELRKVAEEKLNYLESKMWGRQV